MGLPRGTPRLPTALQLARAEALLLPHVSAQKASVATTPKVQKTTQLVQWYPGHIAKAERQLRAQIGIVDVVLEVRDARIPAATRHKNIPDWCGAKERVLVLNRQDMVSPEDKAAWNLEFTKREQRIFWTSGNSGDGVVQLSRAAAKAGTAINERRRARGLRPRPVRACVVGFPNVGKSALINRLLGRRACESAPKPGVTRDLKWVRIGATLDLLDAPGVIPMSFTDQRAARLLAMCNDIGEASYMGSHIAACLVDTLRGLPAARAHISVLQERFGVDLHEDMTGEDFVYCLARQRYRDDEERAGLRVLNDFRTGALGSMALELPRDGR